MVNKVKTCTMAYFFWLFGGFFGLHHLYLRRYKQALIWWCLPGGYFGAGWIRDLWRIPEYVRDANDDPDQIRRVTEKMRTNKSPPFNFVRFMGQMVLGNMLGYLVIMAVPFPEELESKLDLRWVGRALAPAATALGIWLVGNVGRQKGSILYPLAGCYLVGYPLQAYLWNTGVMMTLCGIVAFGRGKEWRRTPREGHSSCRIALALLFCGGLYMGLWTSYLYFNVRVVTREGESIPLRSAVKNFLNSPAWQQFSDNLGKLWDHGLEHGFWSTFFQLVDSLDPLGEKNALKVMGLKMGATQEEIRARYKELSRTLHPDRFSNKLEKEEAHEKFTAMKEAYEKLSDIKKQRARKNKKSQPKDEEQEENIRITL